MTTIAYHHESRTIASDGRITNSGLIISDSTNKMTEVEGVKFWMCGSTCDEELFIKMYFGESSDLIPEVSAIVYDNGKLLLVGVTDQCIMFKAPITTNRALGSGSSFAISAMKIGLNAKEAVEHAKCFDIYTGGDVNVVNLSKI
jgi:ATP-dependent protease HslVU (ClpYQ) peptidase subunit